MYRHFYGPEHPKVASIVNNLGYAKGVAGDITGGRQQFQEALGIAIKSVGEDHPTVGAILVNLGIMQRLSGDLECASPISNWAWKPWRTTPARCILQSLAPWTSGHDAPTNGPTRPGSRAVRGALQIDEGFYGANHANIAGRAMQLANVLKLIGDQDGAQLLSNRAARILSSASELKPVG